MNYYTFSCENLVEQLQYTVRPCAFSIDGGLRCLIAKLGFQYGEFFEV